MTVLLVMTYINHQCYLFHTLSSPTHRKICPRYWSCQTCTQAVSCPLCRKDTLCSPTCPNPPPTLPRRPTPTLSSRSFLNQHELIPSALLRLRRSCSRTFETNIFWGWIFRKEALIRTFSSKGIHSETWPKRCFLESYIQWPPWWWSSLWTL